MELEEKDFIVYKIVLLLPKRSDDRDIFPGCYDFSCAEHVGAGEEYDHAAERGIKEELGLEGLNIEYLGKLGPRDCVNGFMHVYKIVINEIPSDYDKKGIASLEWYKVEEVIKMIEENPRQFKEDLPIVFKWYVKNFA